MSDEEIAVSSGKKRFLNEALVGGCHTMRILPLEGMFRELLRNELERVLIVILSRVLTWDVPGEDRIVNDCEIVLDLFCTSRGATFVD